jgi:hypothetical protein
MKYLFVHDENNKESRDKLDYIQSLNLPNLNIIKMLDAQYMFNFAVQGVPTFLIFSDNSPAFVSDYVVAKLFNDEITEEAINTDYPEPSIPASEQQQIDDLKTQNAQMLLALVQGGLI